MDELYFAEFSLRGSEVFTTAPFDLIRPIVPAGAEDTFLKSAGTLHLLFESYAHLRLYVGVGIDAPPVSVAAADGRPSLEIFVHAPVFGGDDIRYSGDSIKGRVEADLTCLGRHFREGTWSFCPS